MVSPHKNCCFPCKGIEDWGECDQSLMGFYHAIGLLSQKANTMMKGWKLKLELDKLILRRYINFNFWSLLISIGMVPCKLFLPKINVSSEDALPNHHSLLPVNLFSWIQKVCKPFDKFQNSIGISPIRWFFLKLISLKFEHDERLLGIFPWKVLWLRLRLLNLKRWPISWRILPLKLFSLKLICLRINF